MFRPLVFGDQDFACVSHLTLACYMFQPSDPP